MRTHDRVVLQPLSRIWVPGGNCTMILPPTTGGGEKIVPGEPGGSCVGSCGPEHCSAYGRRGVTTEDGPCSNTKGAVAVGEAVAPDAADGAVLPPACRIPAAYPVPRPTSNPMTPRVMAAVGGLRQRTAERQRAGGRSLPCSRMSAPAAGSSRADG
jgi:hypothetical protein